MSRPFPPAKATPTSPFALSLRAEPGRRARWSLGGWALGASLLGHALVLGLWTPWPELTPPGAPGVAQPAARDVLPEGQTAANGSAARGSVWLAVSSAPPPVAEREGAVRPASQPTAPDGPRETTQAAHAAGGLTSAIPSTGMTTRPSVSTPISTPVSPPTSPSVAADTAGVAGSAPAETALPAQPAAARPAPASGAQSAPALALGLAQGQGGAQGQAPGQSQGQNLGQNLGLVPTGAAAADDDAQPPPVYATRPPPAFRWTYSLRRGAMSGQAELALQRTGGAYTLDLKGTVLGMEVLGMSSRGGFGPQGLMPERFVDRRRGKDRLAANFDHASGRITYSGPAVTHALLPGAQDRLSWMVQLAAILEAAPSRYKAGSRIAVSVSGARGDVDTWSFVVHGLQRVNLASGVTVDAVRLTREPRRPYDTQVETWLDPAQHHLPVRARLTVLPGGETLELALQPA